MRIVVQQLFSVLTYYIYSGGYYTLIQTSVEELLIPSGSRSHCVVIWQTAQFQMMGCWLINCQHPTKGPWWWGRKCSGGESQGPHQQTFLRWKECMWWWITNSTKSLCVPVLMLVGWRVLVMKRSATKNQHLYRTHWKVLGQYFKPEFVLSSNKKMYFKGTQFSAL